MRRLSPTRSMCKWEKLRHEGDHGRCRLKEQAVSHLILFLAISPHFLRLVCTFRDAPALSTDAEGPSSAMDGAASSLHTSSNAAAGGTDGSGDFQWDDEAMAAATSRKGTTVTATSGGTSTKDWADLKALDLKTSGNGQDDIAKKLRVEETRAQLAAAREGMEREAQRIKEEKEKKEQLAKDKTAPRFGAAAGGVSAAGGGGKWVSSRIRTGGGMASLSDRFAGAGGSHRLDTEDENLFPDLAAADIIMEKKKHEQPAYAAAKKTPVGGGASWGGGRPKLNLKPKTQSAKEEEDAQESNGAETAEPAQESTPPEESAAPAESSPAPAEAVAAPPTTAAPATAPIKPKNKKKKDISTFGKK